MFPCFVGASLLANTTVREQARSYKGIGARRLVSTPYSRLGVKPSAMPEIRIFWMLDVPSTICSDLASR